MPHKPVIPCPSCGSRDTRVLAAWRGGLRLVRCNGCVATSLDDRQMRARARQQELVARISRLAEAAAARKTRPLA